MENETGINTTEDESSEECEECKQLREELKIEKLKQEISETKRKKAEADKGTLEAMLPDSEINAPEGTHTIDDQVAIECKILTYKAMSEIAFKISKEIEDTKKNINIERVIICTPDDFNSILLYNTFIRQTQLLKKQYEEAIEHMPTSAKVLLPTKLSVTLPITAALTIAPAVVKSFVDIASLFRTDTEIKGAKTEIVYEAVVAEIVRALNSVEIKTIYPVFINKIPDEVLGDLSKLHGLKKEADMKIKECGTNEDFVDEVAFLQNLNTQYEMILAGLVGVDEKTGINRLETLITGKILSTELDKDNAYVLYLKVVDGGGNNKVTQNILYSRLSHSGGAIITYFLLSKEGVIKTSKTLYNITGYAEFKNSRSIEKLNNF